MRTPYDKGPRRFAETPRLARRVILNGVQPQHHNYKWDENELSHMYESLMKKRQTVYIKYDEEPLKDVPVKVTLKLKYRQENDEEKFVDYAIRMIGADYATPGDIDTQGLKEWFKRPAHDTFGVNQSELNPLGD